MSFILVVGYLTQLLSLSKLGPQQLKWFRHVRRQPINALANREHGLEKICSKRDHEGPSQKNGEKS